MGLDDVVATTNVLTDWRHYLGFNGGFARFVRAPYPPRATISVGLIESRARVQIEAVAHRRGRDAQVIEVARERT
jgi:enamine deaminase RidA (YjgF/YER057c/UK114 family)